MIRHVVLVKFKAEADASAIATFVAEVDRLPAFNREVTGCVSGRALDPPVHNGDFDWALTCDLPDWAAMDRYMWHEGHVRTAPYTHAVVQHMIAFDFVVEAVPRAAPAADGPPDGARSPAGARAAGRRAQPRGRRRGPAGGRPAAR